MTYAEAVEYLAALEAASANGTSMVQIGDRIVRYDTIDDMRAYMANLRRDIAAYENRAANRNPNIATPRWRR